MRRVIQQSRIGFVMACMCSVGTLVAQGTAPAPAPAQPAAAQAAPAGTPSAAAPQVPPAAAGQGRGQGRGNQPAGPDFNQFYQAVPDQMERPGVPKGQLKGPFVLPDSKAYPGTQHTYWIHVPAQYDPAVPAHLMVFNDGHAYMDPNGQVHAQNVMDNLIYRRELPVIITVFINPGRRPDQPEPNAAEWGDRTTNRPTEYNTLDDRYASVICDELLPALNKDYNISKDPDHRGIGGTSSGAIAAFTVAWQRPDQFRKVLSIVGSFVNLRGGDAYPDIIRKSEKKPLRVFINDGRNDNRGGRGGYDPRRDWYYQNVQMIKALGEKGYDLNYALGINTHSHRMGATMVPEMLRWLWRDHDLNTDVNDAVGRGFNEPKK
jgi:enterochelin esterase family protein